MATYKISRGCVEYLCERFEVDADCLEDALMQIENGDAEPVSRKIFDREYPADSVLDGVVYEEQSFDDLGENE